KFTRETGFRRNSQGRGVANSVNRERCVRLRFLEAADPNRHGTRECRILQWVDGIDGCVWRHVQTQLADGASTDLREKRIQLELHRLGGQHVFEYTVLAAHAF